MCRKGSDAPRRGTLVRSLLGGGAKKGSSTILFAMTRSEMDAGAWSCGMVAGPSHDIATCRGLIDRIMAEAEQTIEERLVGLLKG